MLCTRLSNYWGAKSIVRLDALRKQRDLSEYTGDTIPDASLAECLSQAEALYGATAALHCAADHRARTRAAMSTVADDSFPANAAGSANEVAAGDAHASKKSVNASGMNRLRSA